MRERNLMEQRYLENIGFVFDAENQFLYHKGNITIKSGFVIESDIFVDGNLEINDRCYVKNIDVLGTLSVNNELVCLNLTATNAKIRKSVRANDISIYCDMFVRYNLHATSVKVYGKLHVGAALHASNVEAGIFDLNHIGRCTSLKNI